MALMRVVAAAIVVSCILGAPALALEDAGSSRSPYARVLFSSLEVERNTSFLSAGSKFTLSDATREVTLFVAKSQGFSLSDGERARRLSWGLDRVERQSRIFVGLERSMGAVFVSVAAGLSQAHVRAVRQPDPAVFARGLAAAFDIPPAAIPALIAAAPPWYWRSLQPPRMRTRIGGVGDVSLWWRPTSAAYLNLAIVGDSAQPSLWTRLRLGYRLDPLPFAFGPEFSASAGANWEKFKLGLHIGDLTLWRFGLSAAGGWMTDEMRKWGTYGSLALHARF
jgi:hypothetical protein